MRSSIPSLLITFLFTAQWTQWLRHNRAAPTIAELHADIARQVQLKQLVAAADARWNSKPLLNAAPRPSADGALVGNAKPCDDSAGGKK